MSLPTPLPPEGEAMASGPPPKGLRYQAHSTLSPRRLNSGPGPHCTKAATPRGPARLARRAPPRAPACGLARERGGGWKGRSLSRPQSPPPAGRPSRPAPTCGARDLPEPPAARPQSADPHRPGAATTREGPCKLSALETRCRAGERKAGLGGTRPIPAHGRRALGEPGAG